MSGNLGTRQAPRAAAECECGRPRTELGRGCPRDYRADGRLVIVLRDRKTEMLSDEELHTRVVKRLSRHDAAASWSVAEDVLCKLEVYAGMWRVQG